MNNNILIFIFIHCNYLNSDSVIYIYIGSIYHLVMKILAAAVIVTVISGILFISNMTHISNVLAQNNSWVKKYGYEAIVPSGTYSYLTAVKGKIYPHLGSAASHVDRMVYMYTTAPPTITVGAGHYEYYSNGQPRIVYMMYVDRGIEDNVHYLATSSPSDVYTAEVLRVNATTFAARINDTTIQTWTCSDGNNSNSPCNKMKIFGAVSWGTRYNNSSFNVNALIYDLQFMRNTDTQYQPYISGVHTLIKCYEEPADLGFKSPRTSNSYNQMIVDAFNRDDCPRSLPQSSTVWLYNNGYGG